MLLGQSEDGRHSPLTSEGLFGTAADGGGGDRDLRAVDFGKTTPNQFHVEDVGPRDKTAVTSEPTSMVLLGTVLLGISGGARFRILRCRPKLPRSNAQR